MLSTMKLSIFERALAQGDAYDQQLRSELSAKDLFLEPRSRAQKARPVRGGARAIDTLDVHLKRADDPLERSDERSDAVALAGPLRRARRAR
jgi:hypothetical protein